MLRFAAFALLKQARAGARSGRRGGVVGMAETGLIFGAADEDARFVAHLVAAGYARAEPSILQPADVFLDQSGEDISGRLLLTVDPSGAEFCLRPEYTIPVCRNYLASAEAGRPAAFSYLGPVFKNWWDTGLVVADEGARSRGHLYRHRPDAPAELAQAGVESFGRADTEAADAEIISLMLETVEDIGGRKLDATIGDTGLFNRVVEALDLPPAWARRVRRGHMRGQSLDAIFAPPAPGAAQDHSGVLAALSNADRAGARQLVGDLLSIAGISSVGGRTPGEIADRFIEQAGMSEPGAVAAEKREALRRFLSISGEPDACSGEMRALARDARLDLHAALDSFDHRLGFIAARGVDMTRLRFDASFGRKLDYYTGFVFEALEAGDGETRLVVGGGRYDGLLKALGAGENIPAVGAAVWCEDRAREGATA
jgi:ATP phosphoribosyltransferase regulatory subunit